jgi:PIN domain nuclease of toxin-antitoxin system
VLLDTHIWLWRLLEPERLPTRTEEVLADTATEICLSPVSVWETLVLARKGRVALGPSPEEWVRTALRRSQPAMVPLTHDIAIRAESLDGFTSRDPADRFLVASALVEELTIASTDKAMAQFKPLATV